MSVAVQPRTLGRYRIVGKIGAGGMAEVYRARLDGKHGFSRDLVLKRILPVHAGDTGIVQMLADEARISARLDHPNIVRVHEFCAEGRERFIVMELVEGWDIRTVVRHLLAIDARLPVSLACFIVRELAGALAYAHRLADRDGTPLQIVHRDVSTSNIRVTPQGGVKLLDFGIAKALGRMRDHKTRTGTLKGNVRYMSPEQADGLPLDKRSDIFSLGIVFHELLTRRRLFDAETELGTLRMVREAVIAPPSSISREVDDGVDRIVLKMLAKAPEDRFQSCDEVVEALTPWVRGADATVLQACIQELGLELESPEEIAEAPTEPDVASDPSRDDAVRPATVAFDPARREKKRRAGIVIGAAALGGLALVGGLGYLASTRLTTRGTTVAPPPPSPVAPPAPTAPVEARPAPVAPKTVHLAVHATTGAAVELDGKTIGTVPVELDLPAADAPRLVRISKPGFEPITRTIGGTADGAIAVELRPQRASHRGTKARFKAWE